MKVHGIDLHQEAFREFCRKWKVRELRVLGSILRNDFRAESDVDFLADFDEDQERDVFDHMDMEDELAAIVGRKVDLISLSAIGAGGNRFYKNEILSTAVQVIAQ